MININKKTCVGCNACVSICPVSCISMVEDNEGFIYPEIDKSKCIGCDACSRVCPAEKTNELDTLKDCKCYACISSDDDTRLKSSSGGVFSLLGEHIIKSGGVVYGACYNDDMSVVHSRAATLNELKKFRGSKYAQSNIGTAFRDAKADLENGLSVLFTGTGCQINGLIEYLGKEYPELYTVDIVCHGVPSSSMLKKYLNYISDGCGNVKDVCFKDKAKGWSKPEIKIEFDSKTYRKALYLDYYSLLFTDGVTLRQSCYGCYSSAGKSLSDLSIGDFWGIENIDSQMFDDKGTSLILVKTDKGNVLLDAIRDKAIIKQERLEDALKGNPNIAAPTALTDRRKEFFADYTATENPDFKKLSDKYCTFYNKSAVQKLKLMAKRCLNKE